MIFQSDFQKGWLTYVVSLVVGADWSVDDFIVVTELVSDSLSGQLTAEAGQLTQTLAPGLDLHQPVVVHAHQVVAVQQLHRVLPGNGQQLGLVNLSPGSVVIGVVRSPFGAIFAEVFFYQNSTNSEKEIPFQSSF